MARRHRGSFSSGGGGRSRPHRDVYHRSEYTPEPHTLALLRAVWAGRDRLRPKARAMISNFLQVIRTRRLTDRQIDVAASIGRELHIGYDDPRINPTADPPLATAKPNARGFVPASTMWVERWGALPAKPPGKV